MVRKVFVLRLGKLTDDCVIVKNFIDLKIESFNYG